ncbi:MAG: hypothetical protein QOG57_689, partial [Pseudonocardiales bacterium]|nr:hypothetical protein [Pseudonocardiales bacterium]
MGAPGVVPWVVVNLDIPAEIKNLDGTLESIEAVLDLPKLRAVVEELSEEEANVERQQPSAR